MITALAQVIERIVTQTSNSDQLITHLAIETAANPTGPLSLNQRSASASQPLALEPLKVHKYNIQNYLRKFESSNNLMTIS
jgi:hypothetical protein